MFELHSEIRLVHIGAVIASGGLFFLRGIALVVGKHWAKAKKVRHLTYAIDSVLLISAFMLMPIVGQYPFVDAWLTVKVVLLIGYIVLGYLAFWRFRTRKESFVLWFFALIVYFFIVSVARTKEPFGFLKILAT